MEIKMIKRDKNSGDLLEIFGIDKEGHNDVAPNRNDMSNVAQYFPKYMRNKEKWDRHKGKWLTTKQLEGIIEGKVDYFWYEKEFLNSKITDNKDNKVEGGC